MKFPTIEEMAKDVAEKALDEYVYEGKTIRQWSKIIKDYDDKQTAMKRIVEKLEKKIQPLHNVNWNAAMEEAIEVVKNELGGMTDV